MFKPKAAVAMLIVAAATLLPIAPAQAATPPAPAVASNSDCVAYAQENLAADQNWVCFGGTLGQYGTSTTGAPKSTKKFTRPARTGLITTQARVNDYHSNSTEALVAWVVASSTSFRST